jgi:hypothetical protein
VRLRRPLMSTNFKKQMSSETTEDTTLKIMANEQGADYGFWNLSKLWKFEPCGFWNFYGGVELLFGQKISCRTIGPSIQGTNKFGKCLVERQGAIELVSHGGVISPSPPSNHLGFRYHSRVLTIVVV